MANRTRLEFKGIPELAANIQRIARQFPEKVRRSLYYRSEIIMTVSKRDFCPVKDGTLRSSGHVIMDPKKLQVSLGYGGPAGIGNVGGSNSKEVGYAVIQHEEQRFAHTVGEAEYLRKPLILGGSALLKGIASDVKL